MAEILQARVPAPVVRDALRAVYVDLFRRGILPDEIDNYRRTSDWFPWLKDDLAIQALRHHLDDGDDALGPQIVFQPPDRLDADLAAHVDRDEYGGLYRLVAGVALTAQSARNGGIVTRSGDRWRSYDLRPGDVLLMDGAEPHASGANETGEPRVAVYWRWQ